MRVVLLSLFISFLSTALAQDLAIIKSIDDIETPDNYVEVSDEGLPHDHYQQLIQQIGNFKFTLLTDEKVRDLFESLKKNRRARMRYPGGWCAQRRYYIQNMLRRSNISTGQFYVYCPSNRGNLRLKDQVSGRYYSYSNFHDANAVAVQTNSGNEFRILDVQFAEGPLTLHEYLTIIEKSQKIKPLRRKGNRPARGYCYWSISSKNLRF